MSASSPSDWDPVSYSYALFLVELFPDLAIEILCKKDSCNVIKEVEQRVERGCVTLGHHGGKPKTVIRGMVESGQWGELKALKESQTPSATPPRDRRRTDPGPKSPLTPSSTASGSSLPQRIPSHEWIFVYHTEEPVRLRARSSGSEEYLIGEDKLVRFPGLTVNWDNPPKKVTLGGEWIQVAENVHLTWNRLEDGGTNYKRFWLVRKGLIRDADVLLGCEKQRSQDRQDKALVSAPLSKEPQAQRVPPFVPTPPQILGPDQASLSTAIYSTHDNPPRGFGQASHNDMAMTSRLPIRSSARTASMKSGPPPLNNTAPSQPSSIMDRPPSRPESASSNRTTRVSRLEIVVVQLTFEHTGSRLLPLDLTKSGDAIIPYLQSHVLKMSGKQLNRSIHEMEITTLKENDSKSQSCALDEEEFFDYVWEGMVEFMRGNRASGASKKAEFRLDIRSSG